MNLATVIADAQAGRGSLLAIVGAASEAGYGNDPRVRNLAGTHGSIAARRLAARAIAQIIAGETTTHVRHEEKVTEHDDSDDDKRDAAPKDDEEEKKARKARKAKQKARRARKARKAKQPPPGVALHAVASRLDKLERTHSARADVLVDASADPYLDRICDGLPMRSIKIQGMAAREAVASTLHPCLRPSFAALSDADQSVIRSLTSGLSTVDADVAIETYQRRLRTRRTG